MTPQSVYSFGIPLILGLILVEVVVASMRKQQLYTSSDTGASLGLLLGNVVVGALLKGASFALHMQLYQFRLFELSDLLPTWCLWLFTFLAIDFVFYWYHRCSHRVRILWAVHMSHHSSQEMNFLVSFRQAWFGPISKLPFFMVLPLVGFDPTIIVVAGIMSTLWGVVGHTQIVSKLGPLEWILNTPSHHRVHHGSNPQYLDKNYGNLLIIWDRLFGTFEPENEKVIYGLVKNVDTFNPYTITIMDWQLLWSQIQNEKKLGSKLALIFSPPHPHAE